MSIYSVRACFSFLALTLLLSLIACVGPQGPPGPAGPPGSGGAPYVWVCTPAHWPNMGSNSRADLYVFNGSTATANVAVNILNKDGVNLFGQVIPGTAPPVTYPGQTGAATVPVTPANTLIVTGKPLRVIRTHRASTKPRCLRPSGSFPTSQLRWAPTSRATSPRSPAAYCRSSSSARKANC
jgi:hypothetical protein